VNERRAVAGDRRDPAVPVLKFPPDADVSGRCAFCRAFMSRGGCFGPLHALNKAILNRQWTTARRVAEEHLELLLGLEFTRRTARPFTEARGLERTRNPISCDLDQIGAVGPVAWRPPVKET
jgi:hypothetical protein